MAVLARGQITITDMRNEGTYTFVRYSDDGGKTFTAASQAALDEVQAGLPLERRNFILKSNFLIKADNTAFASGYYSDLPVANKELLKDKTLAFSYMQYRKGESEQGTGRFGNRFGMYGSIKYTNSQTGDSYVNYPFTTYLAKDNDGTRVVENYVIQPKSGYIVDSISISVQPKAKPAEGNNEIWLLGYPKLEIGDTATPWSPAPEDCTFGTTPGRYMGTAVWDKPYPPLDPSDYTWSEVQGRGVASIVRYFGLSSSGTTEPASYGTSPKSPTATTRYLWGYDLVTYTDGTAVQMPHQVIAVYGDKGDKGDKGVNGKDGVNGTDAVNIIPDPAQIIVDTDDNGLVTELSGANSVIRAYRGGTQITCTASISFLSTGISATVIPINDNGTTTPQVSVGSIAKDQNTGYAYASGYVDLEVVADGKTYKTRLTVGTNIHKVTAKLVKKTDEIGLEVSGVRKEFDGYKTQTNTLVSVTDGLIANTVSTDTFNENNNRINTEFTKIKQTADSISLTVQNGTRPNLLWGSDLNLDGVDTTDKAAIEAHLGVNLGEIKVDSTEYFQYLKGGGVAGADALMFKSKDGVARWTYIKWEKIKVKPNTVYTLSAWEKFKPNKENVNQIYVSVSETGSSQGLAFMEGSDKQYYLGEINQWERRHWTFKTKDETLITVMFAHSGTDESLMWLCRPKLEEGDSATPWCAYDGTEEGLLASGIDLKNRKFTATADNFMVQNNKGEQTFLVDENGRIVAPIANIGDWKIENGKIVSELGEDKTKIELDASRSLITLVQPDSSPDSHLFLKGTKIRIDAENGKIDVRENGGFAASVINKYGVFANTAGTLIYPGTGIWAAASIVGIGSGNVNKDENDTGGEYNYVAGVYGRASNDGDAPCYGGYFDKLKICGMYKQTRLLDTSSGETQLTDTDTLVVAFTGIQRDVRVKLPQKPYAGQEVEVLNVGAGLVFATTPDGSSIYWNGLMNETEIGRHKRTLFTFVGSVKNGIWVETTIGQCGN